MTAAPHTRLPTQGLFLPCRHTAPYQMSVLGLVSIPGMMTGQILAGSDPLSAARSQLIVMFVIGGASCISSVLSIYLAAMVVVDSRHCFRQDKLIGKDRGGGSKGGGGDGQSWFARMAQVGRRVCRTCCGCCWPTSPQGGSRTTSSISARLIEDSAAIDNDDRASLREPLASAPRGVAGAVPRSNG